MPPDTDWHQYMIEFADPTSAAHIAACHLAPALNKAQDADLLHTWWYIRKAPGWRLRYQPENHGTTVIDDLLAKLIADGYITDWTRGIYEPETVVFGGPAAMRIAHDLFHHDSRHLLTSTAEHSPVLGQRETTVLLFSALLRAAGLDRYEQGDVWTKVLDLRPTAHAYVLATEQSARLAQAIQRLITVNPRSVPGLLPEPWVAAFETAGHALADLTRSGRLERGLRAVLAHHFIFHANRVGLPTTDQSTLAALAVDTVFHTVERTDSSGHPTRHHEGPTT
ncbi:MAG: thiopeptide-type bacteriocin biosynthesis protein [Pseudonocardiaceae bacterium]